MGCEWSVAEVCSTAVLILAQAGCRIIKTSCESTVSAVHCLSGEFNATDQQAE